MSEDNFKQAKGNLAFSQQLIDKVRQPQMDQSPQNPPQQSPQQPMQQPDPQKGIFQAVQEAIQPLVDQVKSLTENKDEPQPVEIKIEGEMAPKNEETAH